MSESVKERFELPDLLLIGILVGYLMLMVLKLTAYSDAWDNVTLYEYGKQSAYIYMHPFEHYYEQEYGPLDIRYFGPFLVTVAYFLSKISLPLLPFWSPMDFFRFIYFLTYLAGVVGLYALCKRYFSGWASLGAILLFIFQPLFFGQAPVSPKDTTFMGMMVIAVVLGLKMSDHISPGMAKPSLLSKKQIAATVVWVLFLGLFVVFHYQLVAAFLTWVLRAGEGNIFWQLLLRFGAIPSATRMQGYTERLSILLRWVVIPVLLVAGLRIFSFKAILAGGRQLVQAFHTKYLIPAGILLGLCVSIRILGLFIGLVLLMVLLWKHSLRNWFVPLVAYSLTAVLTIYVTWPYLWPKPVERLIASLKLSLGHQHNLPVNFGGQSYLASNLPFTYIPTLIGVQMTIPLLVLAVVGLGLYFLKWEKISGEIMFLVGGWFLLPLILFMGLRPAFHDNIRHVLFILPPLFLLAGVSLDALFQWLKGRNMLYLGIVAALLVPGVLHIVQYHPYEYIYYNQFVGGTTKGAALYEVDYLALSLSEAVAYVNETVEPDAVVYVFGPYDVARQIIRSDIKLISRNNHSDAPLNLPNTFYISYEQPDPEKGLIPLHQVMAGDVPLGGVYIATDPE